MYVEIDADLRRQVEAICHSLERYRMTPEKLVNLMVRAQTVPDSIPPEFRRVLYSEDDWEAAKARPGK